ncbi:hypothetical protein BGZ83_006458, partial [Gryganskiella cystojenkinii]
LQPLIVLFVLLGLAAAAPVIPDNTAGKIGEGCTYAFCDPGWGTNPDPWYTPDKILSKPVT